MGQPLGAALIARVIAAARLFRSKSGGSGWILTQLYTFDDNATGYSPDEPVTIGTERERCMAARRAGEDVRSRCLQRDIPIAASLYDMQEHLLSLD